MKKRVNLSRVFKQRDKLFQSIRPYIGIDLTGDTLNDIADDLCRILPAHTSRDAVFESCRVLAGATLTKKLAAEFVWRLAGNFELLLHGVPVVSWTRQVRDEWLPVQVTHVDPAFRRGTPGQLLRLRALAGAYCPGTFEQFLSRGSCVAISRIIGFSRAMPLTAPVYFTGLRFLVHVEAAKSGEQPQFGQVDCTSAMQVYNRRIIAVRLRREPCPQNFEHPCEHCPVGADKCKASIFSVSLEPRFCASCNKIRNFDITRSEELCLACWADKKLKRTAGA